MTTHKIAWARGGYRLLIFILMLLGVLIIGIVNQAKATSSISQGYASNDTEIGVGMAASLSIDSTPETPMVERATRGNSDRFVGIVTTVERSLISLTGKNTEILVSASGEATAYVSDLNGQVKQGDIVTVSPLAGILMKAGDTDALLIGAAVEDAPETGQVSRQIQTDDGQERTVLVSLQKVDVNPRSRQIENTSSDRAFLVILGESITGKEVSQVQVIVALVIFMLMMIIEGSIIYGAIRSSITAIGRNPLSKRALFKELLQVSWLALIVLVFGLGTVYMVLWI